MIREVKKRCVHCGNEFIANRSDQKYCNADCRIDANNAIHQQRYAQFKAGAPGTSAERTELVRLKQYMSTLIIVAQDILEEGDEKIRYQGQIYRRIGKKVGQVVDNIRIYPGGGVLLPGGKLVYRSKAATTSSDNCWAYTLG